MKHSLIHTIEVDLTQKWRWDGVTTRLKGGSTLAGWCCYWWHLSSGPTYSRGRPNPQVIWGKGSASFFCSNSDPTPFCPGNNQQYPMTLNAQVWGYYDGQAVAQPGTNYSGQVIPYGTVYYTLSVQ
jgi:hypothetical protein